MHAATKWLARCPRPIAIQVASLDPHTKTCLPIFHSYATQHKDHKSHIRMPFNAGQCWYSQTWATGVGVSSRAEEKTAIEEGTDCQYIERVRRGGDGEDNTENDPVASNGEERGRTSAQKQKEKERVH